MPLSPDVSTDSPIIPDTIFPTTATILWFLAVDPDGKHETGEPMRWSNKLTLTHQRTTLPGGKRRRGADRQAERRHPMEHHRRQPEGGHRSIAGPIELRATPR